MKISGSESTYLVAAGILAAFLAFGAYIDRVEQRDIRRHQQRAEGKPNRRES